MLGTIKKLVADKKFGFITPDGSTGKDIFFHKSALNGVSFEQLQEGDRVEFGTEDGPKGINAKDVKMAQDAGDAASESEAQPAEAQTQE